MAQILYTVRAICKDTQQRGRFLACPTTRDGTSRAEASAKAG